jgi:predicted DNA-binding transcriptional regulator AlpA
MQDHKKKPRRLLSARQVKQRYGGCSDMALWRWLKDPDLGFPKPEYIRKRRFWKEDLLDDFDERREHAA